MSTLISPEKRRVLAAKVQIDPRYLYQCLTGRRDMNPSEARRVEAETDGELTRQMLCQKTYLGIWPELAQAHATIAQAATETVASGQGV